MMEERTIPVEVVYPLPRDQHVIYIDITEGSTVEDAINASKIKEKYPEIDLEINKVGIYGKVVKLDTVLHSGDRVEIYRPLVADPKEIRKQRAKEGKEMRAGAKD